jgi:hypothetical protein
MFRVKTTRRNVKRATSPLRPATDISGVIMLGTTTHNSETNEIIGSIQGSSSSGGSGGSGSSGGSQSNSSPKTTFEQNMNNYFEAETAAVLLSKPWLRLERGLRLQKFRIFSRSYPGLSEKEQDALYALLVKANDSKLLNTKQQIQYENGVILSVKGLKMIRIGAEQATFKIDIARPTKKHSEETS